MPGAAMSAILSASFRSIRSSAPFALSSNLSFCQMLDFASSHDPLPHSCFSLLSMGVKSKLPVVTNKVSIPGSAFNDARSEMVQFFLQRYHHDFLAASCKGKVQMVAESNRLTSIVPCVDHHMHKKPRRASRASAAGHNQIVAAKAATIKSWKVRMICALAWCITIAFPCKLGKTKQRY